ncbi:MAG: DUF2948 family protein [Rhodobiaceae bacterium]|nr:DUF2948 family protein [Rhodobiaceae bacterium]
MSTLRLKAEDTEDLQVIAAYLQDAVLLVQDIAYLPGTRRLALVANRFCWEDELGPVPAGRTHRRARTGFHFDNVEKVQSRNIDQDRQDGVLNLLTISFEESLAPSGSIVLTFSGDGEIRIDVEALEAHLADMGGTWETPNLPTHDQTTDPES